MNLFETIPGNFFSMLSSKNKELYVDAIVLLNRLFEYELNIEVSGFISELIGLLEDREYETEDDEEAGGLTPRDKARLILERFVQTGWVDREYMDGSFTEIITPKTYAIKVMKLICDLGETQVQEYNSLVFSTYSSLKQAKEEQPRHMYEAVLNAKKNTEQLVFELKSLYHGIREHFRKIQGQRDINTLLKDHFDDYKALVDRIYHPIKTMDSIHRYLAPIQEILSDVMGDSGLMDDMRNRAMAVKKYSSVDEAGREIIFAIDYVLDAYMAIGRLVSEIDKKHTNYTKRSVDTIRYNMAADHTISGKITELLRKFSAAPEERKPIILSLMERGVRVNRQEFVDGSSLWHRNVKSRRLMTEPLFIDPEDILSEHEAERLIKFLDNDFSINKIKEYMNKLFGDSGSFSTDDIEFEGDNDFIMLLLASIRAGERNASFNAQIGSGSRDINGYTVPRIKFTKKGGS